MRYERLAAVLIGLGVGCGAAGEPPPRAETKPSAPLLKRALPTDRIAIVGASVSAGFGGAPFGELFAAAAPRSNVESFASTFLFRDPIGEASTQIDHAIAFHAQTIVALDLLFWDVYGSTDPRWRDDAVARVLGELERARAAGAWILVGDVPRITTASELFIARDRVPDAATIAHHNDQISTWARRDRVLFVPFAEWATPLAAGGSVEITPGERVPASSLVGPDGLHANALGAWALLDRLDHLIETALPDTPKDAIVFVRPTM